MINYPCPNCEQELQSLISFDNLCDQYGKDKILHCPYCNTAVRLEYDEYVTDDWTEEEYWPFRSIQEKNK